MIKVVLHLVVFRQAEQVTVLHVQQVFRLGRGRVDNPSMFPLDYLRSNSLGPV